MVNIKIIAAAIFNNFAIYSFALGLHKMSIEFETEIVQKIVNRIRYKEWYHITITPAIVLFTCIFTAMITELSSGPSDLLRTKRVNVKLHSLKEK